MGYRGVHHHYPSERLTMIDEDGNSWFVEEFRPQPIFYWYDMRPDGTSYARPIQFRDGRMVFLDRPDTRIA